MSASTSTRSAPHRYLLLCGLLALGSTGLLSTIPPANAASNGSASLDAAPWYEINVVIYRQPRRLAQTEQWLPGDVAVSGFPANLLTLDDAQPSSPDPNNPTALSSFVKLPVSDPIFQQALTRIQRHPGFGVLYEATWQQPVPAPEFAIPLLIQAGSWLDRYAEVEGTLSVHLARYLHTRVTLTVNEYERQTLPSAPIDWLSTDTPVAFLPSEDQQTPFTPAEESARRPASDAQAPSQIVPVRRMLLDTSRRMRSGEVHYIDHPVLGILVKITPLKVGDAQQPAPDEASDTAPGGPDAGDEELTD